MPWCTPPFELPEPTRLRQTTAPFRSGSSANTSPDFCPASSRSPLLALEQDHRGAEVEVGAVLRRAARAAAQARRVPRIVGQRLEDPALRAGLEVERDDGVAGVGRRRRRVLAGAEVERAALRIDGRAVPHHRAARSPHLHAVAIDRRLGRVRRRVEAPDRRAGRRVERLRCRRACGSTRASASRPPRPRRTTAARTGGRRNR